MAFVRRCHYNELGEVMSHAPAYSVYRLFLSPLNHEARFCMLRLSFSVLLFLVVGLFVDAAPPASDGEKASVTITIAAPGDGYLSAALYEPNGGPLVRGLLFAAPCKAGTQTIAWDGTDDLGRVCKPGEYDVKALYFPEIPKLRYVMNVGRSGNPPYRTYDGKGDWGSNLDHPTGLASNSNSVMMVFGCVEDNTVTGLQRVDFDGNILQRYFSFYPWDGRTATAMDEEQIYLAIYNYQKQQLEVAVYEIDKPRGKIFAELPAPPNATTSGLWKDRNVGYSEGMALSDKSVYVSVSYADAIYRVDRSDASIVKFDLPSPRGLAFHNGKLYAVSGKQLVRLTPEGKLDKTLVTGGALTNPRALAVDKSGNFYVGDSGADYSRDNLLQSGTRQIYVYSSDGKLLRTIGKKGGIPYEGRFDKDGLGVITSITVDPNGRVWVNDIATGFKRNSRWSPDGKLEQQWFSRKLQHLADVLNPGDPRTLYSIRTAYDDSPPGIYAYDVDIDKGEWKPAWFYELTYDRMFDPAKGVYESHKHVGSQFSKSHPDRCSPIFNYGDSLYHHKGKDYMLTIEGNHEGSIHLIGPDAPPKPVAMIGYHHLDRLLPDGTWLANYDQGGPNRWFTWVDINGDGVMQRNELRIREDDPKLAPFKRVYAGEFDQDGSVLLMFVGNMGPQETLQLGRLAPREWLTNGAPVYDWEDVELLPKFEIPDFKGGDGVKIPGYSMINLPIKTADAWYSIIDPRKPNDLRLPGIDGDGWWASRNWRKKLARWDEDGKLLWAVGRRTPGRAQPGEMYNPIMIGGVAQNCVFIADAMTMTWVWHTDGLYIGRLFPDTASGYMGPDGIFVEQQGIGIYEDKKAGKVYTLVNDTACAVHEVLLPKFTSISGGKVRLSAEVADKAIPWDPDGVDPLNRPTYWAVRNGAKGHWPVKVDGGLDGREGYVDNRNDASRLGSMNLLLDGASIGEVRAVYDENNLYLHYMLRLPTPFANAGTELPLCPFTSGAYVDMRIAPNWDQPQRNDVLPGDCRILLTRVSAGDGKVEDFAVGYWSKLQEGKKEPQIIRSPAAEISFDRIGPVSGLQVAWKDDGFDENRKFYRMNVEVGIPLKEIGITGNPADRAIGFDVSVGVANAQGTQRERAAHWAGSSEGVVVDRPGSARLVPATWGTLRFAPLKTD